MIRLKTHLLALPLFFSLSTSLRADENPLAPPEPEKNAGSDLTIDSWNPRPVEKKSLADSEPAEKPAQASASSTPPVAPQEKKVPTPSSSSSSTPAANSAPLTDPSPTPRTRIPMNEMIGTLSSIDAEAQTIRLSIDGGFNPELPYTKETAVWIGGRRAALSALQYGDKVLVRYVGRDLTLKEIEKK